MNKMKIKLLIINENSPSDKSDQDLHLLSLFKLCQKCVSVDVII